ncbi:flagellar hook-basal body complex protein FliE [Actibacterium sp. 188UL27-1]|uniref:flagellar hook-basal body complex protein FliE n=1 Tax=Actibacterium sp. 188UL27-1 TaxID=2786961 RepID=UPI00195BC0C2|nr:flagellar hook-basal body complex protein FliE [Actibacterium sp. 188UL27-1]MBM7066206.1 flagellar hook-basal body complex protein FliE [Actibacterium sp. 188UL27-1]
MDVRSTIAAQTYQGARPVTEPTAKPEGMGEGLAKVTQDFASILQNGEQVAKDATVGKADTHSLVQALSQTKLAVETAVTVRNKLVEAYQEILRMPV